MRVLYFSRDYTVHDRRFLEKIVGRGETFFLRLERADRPLEPRALPDGVREVTWPLGVGAGDAPYATAIAGLRRLVDELRPDVLHAGPVPSCGYVAACSGFHPFVLMSWGSDVLVEAQTDPEKQSRAKVALAGSDAFICDCDAVRRAAQRLVPYDDDRVFQAAWGIDLRAFHRGTEPHLRASLFDRDTFIVLNTRGWEPLHGSEALLRGFHQAWQLEPRLRLVMLGHGSLAPVLRAYVAAHRLERVVRLEDAVPNDRLPGYFRAADLYLSCTRSDGSSISLLEAMATGLPAIVVDAYGNPEWVDEGRNGWRITPDDPAAVAAAIARAVALSPAEREAMARANRVRAEAGADWPRNAERLLAAYDVAISRARRRGG